MNSFWLYLVRDDGASIFLGAFDTLSEAYDAASSEAAASGEYRTEVRADHGTRPLPPR